jgi:hypothetical protein
MNKGTTDVNVRLPQKDSTFTHCHISHQNMPRSFTEDECNKIFEMIEPAVMTLAQMLVDVETKKSQFEKLGGGGVIKEVHDDIETLKQTTGNFCDAIMNKAPVRMFHFGSQKIILTSLTL